MKPISKKISNESGFTLIEVLIAAVLLVFGLIAFGVFSGNLVQKNTLLERKTMAATAAQAMIERLKSNALGGTLVVGTATDFLNAEGGTGGSNVFTRTTVLAESSAGVTEPLKVTITVTWVGPGAVPYVVETLLSQG